MGRERPEAVLFLDEIKVGIEPNLLQPFLANAVAAVVGVSVPEMQQAARQGSTLDA